MRFVSLLLLLLAPLACGAQTLDYIGNPMSGIETIETFTDGSAPVFTTESVTGDYFTATVTGTAATMPLWDISLIGTGGAVLASYQSTDGSILSSGTAQIIVTLPAGDAGATTIAITPTGDSYSSGACGSSPCEFVSMSNEAPGTWTDSLAAPEIDPRGALAALTLLAGLLAVVRGRKQS